MSTEEQLNIKIFNETIQLVTTIVSHDDQGTQAILLTMMPTIYNYRKYGQLTTCLIVDEKYHYHPLDILLSAYISLSFSPSNMLSDALFQHLENIFYTIEGQRAEALLNEAFRVTASNRYIPSFFGILNLLDKLPLLNSSTRKTRIIQLINLYADIIGQDYLNRETLFSMPIEAYNRHGRSAWDSIYDGIRSNDRECFTVTVKLFEAMAKLSRSEIVFAIEEEIERESTLKKSPFTVSSEGGMTSNESITNLQNSFSSPKKEKIVRMPFRFGGFFQNIKKPAPQELPDITQKLTRGAGIFGR